MITHIILDGNNQSRYILKNISSDTRLNSKPLFAGEASGDDIFTGDNTNLKISCYDVQYFSELRKMMLLGNKCKVTIVGDSRMLLWGDYINFIVGFRLKTKNATKNIMTLEFQMKDGNHDITYLDYYDIPPISDDKPTENQEAIPILTRKSDTIYTLTGDRLCKK